MYGRFPYLCGESPYRYGRSLHLYGKPLHTCKTPETDVAAGGPALAGRGGRSYRAAGFERPQCARRAGHCKSCGGLADMDPMGPTDSRDNGNGTDHGGREGGGGVSAWPPAGFVDRDGAAAILGVTANALIQFVRGGQLPPARPCMLPNGRTGVVYAVADLERLRDERAAAEVSAARTDPPTRSESSFVRPAAPAAGASFPPPGWLTQEQTAARLGVGLAMLGKGKWKWRATLAEHAVRMPKPAGWSCLCYPVGPVERVAAELAREVEARTPEGFVTLKEARAMFGVSDPTWRGWIEQGVVPEPRRVPAGARGRGPHTLYAVADLERMRAVVYDPGKPHLKPDGSMHVPPTYVRRQAAWAMFGVNKWTWERWEREGALTCGVYLRPFPKLYPVEEIKRLLRECGALTPPYPDPRHPGCYRVPLSGESIRRREAVVDADVVPLIAAGACSWSGGDGPAGHVKYAAPGGPDGVPLRRLVMGVDGLAAPRGSAGRRGGGLYIGHANDDPLDCRRANLVVRKPDQTQHHRRKTRAIGGRPTSSRFKGVSWNYRTKRWVASIRHQGKSRRLGAFTDEIAAAVAYDEAARQWYGEHARPNFPDGVDAWLEQEAAAATAAADAGEAGVVADGEPTEPARWRRTDLGLAA
jgi:hypothetical protein